MHTHKLTNDIEGQQKDLGQRRRTPFCVFVIFPVHIKGLAASEGSEEADFRDTATRTDEHEHFNNRERLNEKGCVYQLEKREI